MSSTDDIVDRAIEYTNLILQRMPSYRHAALSGLRRLCASLAARSPGDPAVETLEAYVKNLEEGESDAAS